MDARHAARRGDVAALQRIAKLDASASAEPDDNGWTLFHEAVRTGNKEAVEAILWGSRSQDNLKNRLTYTGVTPLNIAKEFLGESHDVTRFLVKVGAIDKHPHRNGQATGRNEL